MFVIIKLSTMVEWRCLWWFNGERRREMFVMIQLRVQWQDGQFVLLFGCLVWCSTPALLHLAQMLFLMQNLPFGITGEWWVQLHEHTYDRFQTQVCAQKRRVNSSLFLPMKKLHSFITLSDAFEMQIILWQNRWKYRHCERAKKKTELNLIDEWTLTNTRDTEDNNPFSHSQKL